MTILSSRKKTCIQETDKNKDKLCNELLDPRLKVSIKCYIVFIEVEKLNNYTYNIIYTILFIRVG